MTIFLKQLSVESTRLNNVLDLVITSTPDRVEIRDIISSNEAGIFTDHAILQFDIQIKTEKTKTSRCFVVYVYRNTDFNRLHEAVQAENLSAMIDPTQNINENWSNWVNAFKSLISRYVKTEMVKRKISPPWFNGEILHTLHMKDNIRKKHKLNQSELLCNKLKELRSRVKHMVANARKSVFLLPYQQI